MKIKNAIFLLINLLTVTFLFTIIDHYVHGLEDYWSVPAHYFVNKVPAIFLLVIIGSLISIKIKNIWLRSLIVGAVAAILIQTKYYLQGYPHSFVYLFAMLHFLMIYPLLVIMFHFYNKHKDIV